MNYNFKQKSGFTVLVTILIVSAIGLTIGAALLLLGLDLGNVSLAEGQSAQARGLVNLCAEKALLEIKTDINYASSSPENANFSLAYGDCSYNVESGGGEARTIKVEGQVNSVIRRARINIDQIAPSINVSEWQELATF
jgi:hypothetical protein